jgi:hypothetical protein
MPTESAFRSAAALYDGAASLIHQAVPKLYVGGLVGEFAVRTELQLRCANARRDAELVATECTKASALCLSRAQTIVQLRADRAAYERSLSEFRDREYLHNNLGGPHPGSPPSPPPPPPDWAVL